MHCCKAFPLFTQIPVYATAPVIAFGRTLLQDLYASAPLAATFLPKASLSESGASSNASTAYTAESNNGASEGNGQSGGSGGRILLQPPTGEEIAGYFSLIHPLKYSQPHQPLSSPFSPPLNGLTLTAYSAGHTVGGTIWHIQYGMESVVHAVDWNQARESVIAGAAWFGGSGASGTEVIEQLRKPTALICSTKGGDKIAPPGGRKRRDELLLDMICSSLLKGGTVLIPTDTSARVLELVYALEHAWRNAAASAENSSNGVGNLLRGADLYLADRKAHNTMRLARSMLEWMDENVIREFEAGESVDGQKAQRAAGQGSQKGDGPFIFKYLKVIEQRKDLERILADQKPKVILAPDSSLEWGFAHDFLRTVGEVPNNLLLLTDALRREKDGDNDAQGPKRKTLGRMVWQWYEERTMGVASEKGLSDGELLEQVQGSGRELSWMDARVAPLDAGEQVIYQQYLAAKKQLENTTQARGQENLDNAADAFDDRSSSTSSEASDPEQQGRVLNFSTSLAHSNRNKLGLSNNDLGVNVLLRRKNVHDYDVRNKRGRERMFPYMAPRKRGDEYGEFIRPEEYLRAEEREEIEMQQLRSEAQTKLGQKRRWDETMPNGNDRSKRRRASRQGKDNTENQQLLSEDADATVGSSGDEDDEAGFQGPAKVEYVKATMSVNARIAFVDFMGLHDKRSLEMLIPLIQPRKLILVGGMKDDTSALAAECKKLLAAKVGVDMSSADAAPVFTPSNGQAVDASVDTNAWMVKLGNDLVRRLKWQPVRGLGVVALTGQLKAPDVAAPGEGDSPSANKKQKLLKEESSSVLSASTSTVDGVKPTADQSDIIPMLDLLPASVAASRSTTRSLHVGDMRLADLRRIMQASGHVAEFRGEGTLLIDGLVAVRKSGTGQIGIEGAAASDQTTGGARSFLEVKKKIYEGLAVVARS